MLFRLGPQPESALEAAASFHGEALPEVMRMLERPDGKSLVILFPPASYDHGPWRLAVVQDLARAAAPVRVNGVVGDDEAAVARALEYLASAPGITGQILAVDGKSGEMD